MTKRERTIIMGISIIIIMLFHYQSLFSGCLFARYLQFGDIGVDLFALLSGYGISKSLDRNNLLDYAKKRFLRIMPTYWIITMPFVLYQYYYGRYSFAEILGIGLPLINIKSQQWWYIPFCIWCYAAAPIFKKLLYKGIVIEACIVLILYIAGFYCYDSCFFIRFAEFFIGMIIATNHMNNRTTLPEAILFVIITVLLFDSISRFGFDRRYIYIIYSIVGIVMIQVLPVLISNRYVCNILSFFGEISLEIYLIHNSIVRYFLNQYFDGGLFFFVLYFSISIFMAYLVHLLISKFRIFSVY